ncbi:MAG: signal peptidase II [Candidatus Peribacteraceae bacterium]
MVIFAFTCLLSFAGSLLTAHLIDTYLLERISILGSFLGFERSYNQGIAWGVQLPAQSILILIALLLMGWYAWSTARTRMSQAGFGLILGGALANVVDRFPDGLVTDMIQVGAFPVFNVADSCITVGLGLLLLEIVLKEKKKKKTVNEAESLQDS